MFLSSTEILLGIVIFLLVGIFSVLILGKFYKPRTSETTSGKYSANFPSAARDVLIASLAKGQLPIALLGLIFVIILLKLSPDNVYQLVSKAGLLFKSLGFLGWILFVLTIFISVRLSRRTIKLHHRELMNRDNEKKVLQERIENLNEELHLLKEQRLSKSSKK